MQTQSAAADSLERKRLLLLFASAFKALAIYPAGHPGIERTFVALYRALLKRLSLAPHLSLVFLPEEVAIDNLPESGLSGEVKRLAAALSASGVNRLTLRKGIGFEELAQLVRALRQRTKSAAARLPRLPHVAVEQVGRASAPEDGLAAAPCLYDSAMLSLKEILTAEETFGAAHLKAARDIVAALASGLATDARLIEALYFLRRHDDYTLTHAINVCGLAVAQARALGLPEPTTLAIGLGALLHDIGKREVPAAVLTKPGRLDEQEVALIQTHPLCGARHLCLTAGLPDLVPLIAIEHHLRFDATGYPQRGRAHPPNLGSQLVQLADVYDALRTDRPYRSGKTLADTLAIMGRGEGSEFHPLLLARFRLLVDRQAARLGLKDGVAPLGTAEGVSETLGAGLSGG